MRYLCIVELQLTVNNIKIFSVAQKLLLYRPYVAGNNKTHFGLYVKRPIFLPYSKQIWSLYTDLHEVPSSNFMEIHPMGDALIHKERSTDRQTDGRTKGRKDMTKLRGAFHDYATEPDNT
jgi:hypothetical protein